MKVVLNIPANCPLGPDEVGQLRQLLRDALGEFVDARGGRGIDEPAASIMYVTKRYPDLQGMQREKKIDEVMARKQLAQKLLLATESIETDG